MSEAQLNELFSLVKSIYVVTKSVKFFKNIFLIGLGGSGKSTVGKLLAKRLNFDFIDLDDKFRETYRDIGKYIKNFGSKSYGVKNSEMFDTLLKGNSRKTVFVLPPGFVVCKKKTKTKMIDRHLKFIRQSGVSVLLLPSSKFSKCLKILVKRQLQRKLGYIQKGIIEDISVRFYRFKKLGDVRIYSTNKPKRIVDKIVSELNLA